jgi:hypothetical protein
MWSVNKVKPTYNWWIRVVRFLFQLIEEDLLVKRVVRFLL